MKPEATVVAIEHRDTDDIGRQQVARKLNPLIIEPEEFRQQVSERRFTHPGQVFDQQVAAREQARKREAQFATFTEDDVLPALEHACNELAGIGR